MSKKEVLDAVFFDKGNKPKCPDCLYGLDDMVISDYGTTEKYLSFVSPCKKCGESARYYTDKQDEIVKTKIVERNESK